MRERWKDKMNRVVRKREKNGRDDGTISKPGSQSLKEGKKIKIKIKKKKEITSSGTVELQS
jgi:hypothetical protein